MSRRPRWTGAFTLVLIMSFAVIFFASAGGTDAAAVAATTAATQPATPSSNLPLRFRYRYYVDASLLIAETAKDTKLTLSAVRRDLRQSMTLADIATSNKCDVQLIIKAVSDKEQTAIDRLVKYKLLSQKKADTYLAGLKDFLTEIMNFQFYHPFTVTPSTNKHILKSTQAATATP
ncbi:MAG TPA: hypothetical protein VKQ72_01970 [Aggregatilineales bacterium]|nr:hypothetical protein [Aggregatilineales bacterium]